MFWSFLIWLFSSFGRFPLFIMRMMVFIVSFPVWAVLLLPLFLFSFLSLNYGIFFNTKWWYYSRHVTESEERNTISLSRISIDVTLLQTQGDSTVPDTKVFYYYSNCIQVSSCHRSTREKEREGELIRVYEERNTHCCRVTQLLSLTRRLRGTQLNSQLFNSTLN